MNRLWGWLLGLACLSLVLSRGFAEGWGAILHWLDKPAPLWAVLLLFGVAFRLGLTMDNWTAKAAATLRDHAARITAIDHQEFGSLTDLEERSRLQEEKAERQRG